MLRKNHANKSNMMFCMTPHAIEELRKWRNAHLGADLRQVDKDIELINALLSLPDDTFDQSGKENDVTTSRLKR